MFARSHFFSSGFIALCVVLALEWVKAWWCTELALGGLTWLVL